ncbi:MAG: extracellular solute-binding protein, partial [Anaerolineales bacterium]|nr:extracellular solute-binding protein [Anaerolineales bacterium]
MRRLPAWPAALTALALLITSCAPAATPAPTSPPATAAPAPTAVPTAAPAYTFEVPVSPEVAAWYIPGRFDGQEINVAVASGLFSNDAYRKVMEDLQAKFQELSGATVNYVILPENELSDKVRLEMVANSGKYDMTESGAGGAKDFGASGFLLELPKPIDSADIFPGDLAQYSLGDKLLGYPRVGGTNLLYWRTDLFEQAGLDPAKPPETYTQFREYALKLTPDVNGKHPGEDGFDPNNIAV